MPHKLTGRRITASPALPALGVLLAGVMMAAGGEKDKAAQPDAVLFPLAPRAQPAQPPLPREGFPMDSGNYQNPLIIFTEGPASPPLPDEMNPDLLPPLLPMLEEDAAPAPPPTAAQLRLMALGEKVAAAVVGIRVWDSLGVQLASGIGSYVTTDGILLTDAGLLHPEIAEKTGYITLVRADGTSTRAAGFYLVDQASGVALLQSEDFDTTPIELAPTADFSRERAAHVLAVSEKRGLVLAEARVQADPAITALGWLNVRGDDSPGAAGSPVLDEEGQAIAIIGMVVPLKEWKNFALPVDAAALALRQKRAPLRPLSELPRTPGLRQVVQDPAFVEAFQTLEQKRLEPAMRELVQITRKYPRSAECWALLGLAASRLGAGPEAVNCQRKAVALDPKAGLYWHQLAFAKMRESPGTGILTGEDSEALSRAVEQRPDDALAWLPLAGPFARAGDLDQADAALRRVTVLSPAYAQAHYLQAYVRGRKGDYAGAETSIQRALQLDPKHAEAWYYQGLLHDKKGAPASAAKAWRNTVRLRPDHPQAWLNLAHAHKKAGQATEARQAILEHQKVRSAAAR